MRVYFDARMIDHPGIGRYIKCLLPCLYRNRELNLYLLGNRDKIKKSLGIDKDVIDFDYPIYSIQEQAGFLKLKKIIGNNILHVPHYNVPILATFNLVVTIHDIIHILYPQGAKSKFASTYMKFMVKKALSSAKQVICVSNSTKNAIEERLLRPVPEGRSGEWHNVRDGEGSSTKLHVIYEGIDEVFKKIDDKDALRGIKEKYRLPDKFILYVGSIRRHKNIAALLKIFEQFNKKVPHIWLVMVGRYSQPIDLNSKNVLYLGEVASDADLAGIYNQASCLFNLSLYEGFGLTILEAQMCGLPVVCSDIPPHKEIGQDAVIAVNVSYIDQIYESLYNILFDDGMRKALILKGINNARRFDWQTTADNTVDLYKKVDNESSDSSRLAIVHAGRGENPQCLL